MIASRNEGSLNALSGVLFVALSVTGAVLAGLLAPVPYPYPGAPPAEIVRYFAEGRAAVLAAGLLQVLAAISLLAFVVFARRTVISGAAGVHATVGLSAGAGVLAASLLFLTAILMLALALPATAEAPALAGALHYVVFVAGGPAHVASLGLFVGGVSLAASRQSTGTLPRWIAWEGIVAATLSLACLFSFLWFPASVLIPIGRLLCFVWIVNTSLALARGGRRAEAARVGEVAG
ncbi:MAG: hypothetical protein H0X19_03975 [Rubrobacter sp.]|nr:hypothetical protein [Rubrobacter sp.]